MRPYNRKGSNLKPKDLCGIPWRVALALQADGWWLRSDIIWHKPNPMPESVTDRPTKSHEYLFLLSKSQKYFYDAFAIRENCVDTDAINNYNNNHENIYGKAEGGQAEGESEIQCQQTRKGESEEIQGNGSRAGVSKKVGRIGKGEDVSEKVSSGISKIREKESCAEKIFQNKEIQGNTQKISSDGKRERMFNAGDSQEEVESEKLYQHTDVRSVERNKAETPSQMCLLPEENGTTDDGSCDTNIKGRESCGRKHCSGLSKLQHQKGQQVKIPGGWDIGKGSHSTIHREGRTSAQYQNTNLQSGRNRRSVWTIATQPQPAAHFACFPEKLVEPCILAGTSEKGCCPECGSPWERVVEKSGGRDWHNDKIIDKGIPGQIMGENGYKRGQSATPLNDVQQSQTIGWRKSCDCKTEETKPCVVLDTFLGSGASAIVANKYGRKFVGIDLSEEYLQNIAIPRIEKETAQKKLW